MSLVHEASVQVLTLGQNHGHFAVFVYFFDWGCDGDAFLLGFYAWWCAIVCLLDDLLERLELVRVSVDICDCQACFLTANRVICAEGNVLSGWASASSEGGLSAIRGLARHDTVGKTNTP